MSDGTVQVTLFKPSGKYCITEPWRIPAAVPREDIPGAYRNAIGPYDMIHSPDFRRIAGGAVLIEAYWQLWGYPHLFPGVPESAPASAPERTEWTGQCMGGPDDGNLVTATVPRFLHEVRSVSWLDGAHAAPSHVLVRGWYAWSEDEGAFRWEGDR